MFVSNCRRCHLPLNLTSFVLNVSKSYTLCPLAQTQLYFLVIYGHNSYDLHMRASLSFYLSGAILQ
ncbi:hypothetical protein Hanom_Chr02g00155501 [Helianthus anomalus]